MVKSAEDVKHWWTEHPMTYGHHHGETVFTDREQHEIGTPGFYEHVDAEFYRVFEPLHDERGPFAKLFPYDEYGPDSRVIEVGCGMGTMASNWAERGVRMTAVDLNPASITGTTKRFEMMGIEADIREADGRRLPYEDASFDYAYSWGVLHHSPDWEHSIGELMRVLKPGGGFGVMLYSRHSLFYHYRIRFLEGWLHRENRFLNPLELASRYSDGYDKEGNPHTWPITREEGRAVFSRFSDDLRIEIIGSDLDNVFRHLLPGISAFIPRFVKKPWARRYGWSMWLHGTKRAD